jgi:phosphatidylglycerophosphate synthase
MSTKPLKKPAKKAASRRAARKPPRRPPLKSGPQAASSTPPLPPSAPPPPPSPPPASSTISFSPALCIVGDDRFRLWALSLRERLVRQFAREGLTTVLDQKAASRHHGPVILVRADAVLDQPLVSVLLKRPSFLLLTDDKEKPRPVAASVRASEVAEAAGVLLELAPLARLKLLARAPSQLDTHFWKALRKRETPYALLVDEATRPAVEWRMFMGTYKGATDLVTKHVWPVPAFHVTRFLAPRGITPNMVTTIGAIMTALAFWLFLQGHFGLGLIAAWAMTFLDTVDGKLARTTLTSSKWGDVFDHGIDLVHPPFWYAAWALGLGKAGYAWSPGLFWAVLIAILGGYVLQRVIEGAAIKWLGLEIHIWRPIDTFFRQITARRNPNLILLTISVLINRPDLGLLAVAVWTVACLALHGVQIAQAFATRRRTGPLVSWMTRS